MIREDFLEEVGRHALNRWRERGFSRTREAQRHETWQEARRLAWLAPVRRVQLPLTRRGPLYSFSSAPVINYHKPDGLKQQNLFYSFGDERPKVSLKLLTGVVGAPGKHLFPGFSHFVGAVLTPWLMCLYHTTFLCAFDPAAPLLPGPL